MAPSTSRLALLSGCAIVLPTMVLAYLGVQAVRDDTQRIRAEQQRLAGRCRVEFDTALDRGVEALRQVVAPDSGAIADLGDLHLRHVFLLDRRRRGVAPAYGPRQAPRLREEFATPLARARQVEFAAGDPGRALSLYRELASAHGNDSERAIALWDVARAARKAGDEAAALNACAAIIRDHPRSLGERGEHLATYAHLQQAELLLAQGFPVEALESLERWAMSVRGGHYPVHEGATYHLERAAAMAESTSEGSTAVGNAASPATRETAARLTGRLRETLALVRFVERHDREIRQPHLPDEAYLPGDAAPLFRVGSVEGEAYLITVVPAASGLLAGGRLDLEAIGQRLSDSVLGGPQGTVGYELVLVDDRGGVRFRQEHDDDLSLLERVSDRGIPLSLGLYADDSARLREQFQRRRWLLLSAVLVLAVAVGSGGYLLARDAARERRLSELRSEFVSSVSHELKTPLASIRLYAETLLMGRFRSEQERTDFLESILREGERLSRLVDNVLEFARIEKGRRTYHPTPEDLTRVGRLCLDLFGYRLQAEGFQVAVDIPDHLDPVPLDRDAVSQAILNLLSNAVKYSPDEKDIRLRIADSDGGALVEVADRGIGMSAEEQARIFEPFYRVESDQLHASGSGLGLAVVHHVMDGHGGRVEVESTPGVGTTFRLVFPRPTEA